MLRGLPEPLPALDIHLIALSPMEEPENQTRMSPLSTRTSKEVPFIPRCHPDFVFSSHMCNMHIYLTY